MLILYFIVGMFIGGITMMVVMSCIQVSAHDEIHDRDEKDEDTDHNQ